MFPLLFWFPPPAGCSKPSLSTSQANCSTGTGTCEWLAGLFRGLSDASDVSHQQVSMQMCPANVKAQHNQFSRERASGKVLSAGQCARQTAIRV